MSSNIYRVFWSICSAHCSLTLRLPLANRDNFRYNFELNNTIHSLSWSSGPETSSIGFCWLNLQTASLRPKEILQTISSFLAIFQTVPPLYSVMGFDGRSTKTISAELVQAPNVCVIPTFSFEDLDKVLAGPAIKIFDRYDHHSVLQFLLMKLRSATGSVWLNDLPELRKVISFSFRNVSV